MTAISLETMLNNSLDIIATFRIVLLLGIVFSFESAFISNSISQSKTFMEFFFLVLVFYLPIYIYVCEFVFLLISNIDQLNVDSRCVCGISVASFYEMWSLSDSTDLFLIKYLLHMFYLLETGIYN